MPNFSHIAPSKESKQQLSNPITVVSRLIAMNSIVAKHSHSWGQFVYAHKGVLIVTTTDERYIVPPEQGVWLLPEVEHEVTAISDVALTSFYFDNALLDKLPAKSCVLTINNFLKVLILEANQITFDYDWNGTDGRLLQLILDRLSLAPAVIFQLPFPKDPRLLTMLSALQKEPSLGHNLAQWGKIVGASTRSLSRLFKNETGLSYRVWRQRLNIQIALSELSKGTSVTNISLHLGYESPSAFIHMFKENTGVTPKNYRDKT